MNRSDGVEAVNNGHEKSEGEVTNPSRTTQLKPAQSVNNSTSSALGVSTAPPLLRTVTNTSLHARTSLRRMATHETGGFDDHAHDHEEGDDRLDTHHEDHEDHEDHEASQSDSHEESKVESHGDSDESGTGGKKGKKEVELQDQTNLLPVRQVIFVFVGLTCAIFCSLLDQTIVTTALPTLGKVFDRADIAPWVGTAYLLTSTSLQPIYGRLSDIFGRKLVLLGSLVIFFIGSLLCAIAKTMIQLIIFRAIQGIGGGGILTLSMIIISDVVTLKERGKYQGILGCFVALANSLGPIIGGIFTEKVTWRWCFYINLPITALSMVVIIFLLPLRRVKGGIMEKLRKLDWYGSILTIAWAVLVLLGLSWAGNQYPWASAAVLTPLLIGLALLGVFLLVEARVVPLPLIPLRIFKDRTVAAAMLATFFSGMIFYSTLYYLPTYFQVVRGTSPIHSGVLLLPLVVVQTVASFTSGLLVSKTGDYWWNLVVGFALWSIGVGLLSLLDENTSQAKVIGYQILYGAGAGQTFQTSLVAIQASVERREMATATGFRNFLRMLGGTLALTICSTIINNLVRNKIRQLGLTSEQVDRILSDPSSADSIGLTATQRLNVIKAYAHGIRACFWFLTPCAVICVILTVCFIKRVSLKREDDAVKKAEAKAWVDSKKHKKHGGKPSDSGDRRGSSGSQGTSSTARSHTAHDGVEEGRDSTVVHRLEESLEKAGRGEAEAMGVDPSKKEVAEQGGIDAQAKR